MAVVLHCITVFFKLRTKGIKAEKVLIVMKICGNAKNPYGSTNRLYLLWQNNLFWG